MDTGFHRKSVFWSRSLKDESEDSPFELPALSPKVGLGTFKLPSFASAFVVRSDRSKPVPRLGPPSWDSSLTSRAFDTASKAREGWWWVPASLGFPPAVWVGSSRPSVSVPSAVVFVSGGIVLGGVGCRTGGPVPPHLMCTKKWGGRFSLRTFGLVAGGVTGSSRTRRWSSLLSAARFRCLRVPASCLIVVDFVSAYLLINRTFAFVAS